MKILISGASGFIGSELVESLLKESHEISILTRNKKETKEAFAYPVNIYTWDELDSIEEEWQGYIHLAGAGIADKRWSSKRKNILYDSRIDTGEKLARKAIQQKNAPEFFLCGSAIGIYGNRGNEELDESSPLGDGFLPDLCKAWETTAKPLEDKGVRLAYLRTGIVLGTNEGALKQLVQLVQMGILSPLGNGRQYMSWIHIQDWVRACQYVINNKELSGPICFTGIKPIEHKKFMQTLCDHFDTWLLPRVPGPMIKIILGEMAQILLDSQKVMPKKLKDHDFEFYFKNLADCLKDLYPEPKKGLIFKKKLLLPKKKEEIFSFFSSPDNLEKITPPFLKFKVKDSTDKKVKTGTIINYQLKLHGIPLRWRTKILDYQENLQFIDNQEKGPYKKWHHLHKFEDHPSGTLMTDIVRYNVGYGILGKWIAYLYVNHDVQKIFEYRTKVLKKLKS